MGLISLPVFDSISHWSSPFRSGLNCIAHVPHYIFISFIARSRRRFNYGLRGSGFFMENRDLHSFVACGAMNFITDWWPAVGNSEAGCESYLGNSWGCSIMRFVDREDYSRFSLGWVLMNPRISCGCPEQLSIMESRASWTTSACPGVVSTSLLLVSKADCCGCNVCLAGEFSPT